LLSVAQENDPLPAALCRTGSSGACQRGHRWGGGRERRGPGACALTDLGGGAPGRKPSGTGKGGHAPVSGAQRGSSQSQAIRSAFRPFSPCL
ncbi:unnamed protein product, partial [Rangifer tarandus platyrhynchus]